MTNTNLLRKKITSSGYRIQFVAQKCGLTYQGFMNKVNNLSAFTAPEIKALRELLKLSPEEVEAIFFADDVDEMPTISEAI